MSDWSHGYDVSMGYTYGFGREMSPDWLDLCVRIAGFTAPQRKPSRPFRYLDLGSGQGVGLCLLAAANPRAEFLGVDFLPDHIAHSEKLAAAAGLTNVRFSQADFVDLASAWPEEFGTFDYAVLHGVYSWVSPELRAAVVQCVDDATRAGSLIYVGYNTQPGWLGATPFQHVARLIKDAGQKSGRAVFDESIALFDRLRGGQAPIFRNLPALAGQVDAAKTRDTTYLVHEFLHEHWLPLWHSEVAREFGRANLDYVGTATIAESLLPGLLSTPVRDAIAGQPTSGLRQDVQDIAINQKFRRDIFCRGPRPGSVSEIDAVAKTHLHLIAPPDTGSTLGITTAFGEVSVVPQGYAEVVAALESGSRSIAELEALPGLAAQGSEAAAHVLRLLLHSARLAVGATKSAKPQAAHRLNAVIAREASQGAPYDHIAAPALGSAIAVSSVNLMMLDCWLESAGDAKVPALAKGVSDRLEKVGRKLQHAGQSVQGAEAEQRLTQLATRFVEKLLPRWRGLGAVP